MLGGAATNANQVGLLLASASVPQGGETLLLVDILFCPIRWRKKLDRLFMVVAGIMSLIWKTKIFTSTQKSHLKIKRSFRNWHLIYDETQFSKTLFLEKARFSKSYFSTLDSNSHNVKCSSYFRLFSQSFYFGITTLEFLAQNCQSLGRPSPALPAKGQEGSWPPVLPGCSQVFLQALWGPHSLIALEEGGEGGLR